MSGNTSPVGKLTLEGLNRFLSPESDEGGLCGYLQAAAVLSAFDPFGLNPCGVETPAPKEQAVKQLLPLCEPVMQGAERGLWTLPLPQRREALSELATRPNMKEALAANPTRPDSLTQRVFERLLEPSPLELDSLAREELAAVLEVLEWVVDILDGLPEATAVRKELARADLLAPMRRLAGRDFVGRERELEQLGRYVFGPKRREPLFVFGPGGVGKSTLLARFVLAHAAPQNVAVAYVDIDRPVIRPERPLTLLLETITQLRQQLDPPADAADSLVKEVTFAMSRYEPGLHFESASPEIGLLALFGNHVGQWLQGRTALVIVDTLEEAQFLGSDVIWPLISFLVSMNTAAEGQRVILSGRALPREYLAQVFDIHEAGGGPEEEREILARIPEPIRPVNLGVLDEDSALELLKSALGEDVSPGIGEGDLRDVVGLVSRNPMCIKLAARLLRDEGVEKLRTERAELFAKLRAEKIQALLYGRILRHIHDDDVRKVAYPGLIVRRIDPAVIGEVLAKPCGLKLKPERDEWHIFNDLAKEVALVYVDPEDGSLRHRADVRRSMLEDLTDHVRPSVISQVDRRAAAFYRERDRGPADRAEELYHLMRLGKSEAVLNSRWVPDAAQHLQGALEEVPARQRVWLAERLNVSLDEASREAASQEAWESQAARSADRFLRSQLPEKALKVLQERRTRSPRSRLYALEAEAYRFLGRHDEALTVARAGVEALSRDGAIDMTLELLLKMAVIEEGRGRLKAAEGLLDEAEAVAAHTSNAILRLRVRVARLRVQRQLRPAAREERASLRAEVMRMLEGDMLRQLRSHPVLLREAAAELGKQDARLTAAALETLGAEVSTDEQAQAFGRAVANIVAVGPKYEGRVAKAVEDLKKVGYAPEQVREWVTGKLTRRDTKRLGQSVASEDVGSRVLSDLRNYFRAGVESSLKRKVKL